MKEFKIMLEKTKQGDMTLVSELGAMQLVMNFINFSTRFDYDLIPNYSYTYIFFLNSFRPFKQLSVMHSKHQKS